MEQFNVEEWEHKKDIENITYLKEHCIKGQTKEHLSDEDAETFYNEFVKERILYHYPEDSQTLVLVVDTYNYLNKWK